MKNVSPVLAATAVVLAVAGCGGVAPIGPYSPPSMPPPRQLTSPMVLQVMRTQPNTATGGCRAGWNAVVMPPGAPVAGCYRPVGTPLRITSAAVSSVTTYRPAPAAGQPRPPTQFEFTVAVPAAKVAAVTALITRVYNADGAFGISVAGKLWQAPRVLKPFPGRQLQITMLSRNEAVRLHRLLV